MLESLKIILKMEGNFAGAKNWLKFTNFTFYRFLLIFTDFYLYLMIFTDFTTFLSNI
jgi:hypothetical protein